MTSITKEQFSHNLNLPNYSERYQAKKVLGIADACLALGFNPCFVTNGKQVFCCVEEWQDVYICMYQDGWDKSYKCKVLPEIQIKGIAVKHPPGTQRTLTLSAAKIRKEIEKAKEVYTSSQQAAERVQNAILAMAERVQELGGTVDITKEWDFKGKIRKDGLEYHVTHVLNGQFEESIKLIAPQTLDTFCVLTRSR